MRVDETRVFSAVRLMALGAGRQIRRGDLVVLTVGSKHRHRHKTRHEMTTSATCPSGVLRLSITGKYGVDTRARFQAVGVELSALLGRCSTRQHIEFHPGSVGSGFDCAMERNRVHSVHLVPPRPAAGVCGTRTLIVAARTT